MCKACSSVLFKSPRNDAISRHHILYDYLQSISLWCIIHVLCKRSFQIMNQLISRAPSCSVWSDFQEMCSHNAGVNHTSHFRVCSLKSFSSADHVWFEFKSSLIKPSFNIESSKKESIRSLVIKVQVRVLGSVSPTAATSLVALVVY